jgi:hypothetical protein
MSKRRSTKYLVVHVTATPPNRDIGAKEVDAMHKARGWSGIGYHYVIRRNGVVEKGRPEEQVGAHVKGFNSNSVGVAMVGGVDSRGRPENNMTAAQFTSLENLLRLLAGKYPGAGVCGHRDLSPDGDGDGVIEPHEYVKACPCFDAIPWAKARGLPAARIRGTWRDAPVVPAPAAPTSPKPAQAEKPTPAPVTPPKPETPPAKPVEAKFAWGRLVGLIIFAAIAIAVVKGL